MSDASLLVTLHKQLQYVRAARRKLASHIAALEHEAVEIRNEIAEMDTRRTQMEGAIRRLLGAAAHTVTPAEPFESGLNRYDGRTITQAATTILLEEKGPLHVNEIYQRLVEGGFRFNGDTPTISITTSLSRNGRFQKVAPGTFDLMIRRVS